MSEVGAADEPAKSGGQPAGELGEKVEPAKPEKAEEPPQKNNEQVIYPSHNSQLNDHQSPEMTESLQVAQLKQQLLAAGITPNLAVVAPPEPSPVQPA
jgi:hypothetical protein